MRPWFKTASLVRRGTVAPRALLRSALGASLVGVVATAWWLHTPQAGPPTAPLTLEREPRRAGEASIVLAGDFAPTDAAMPFLREHGDRYPYWATASLFRDSDVAFANLEAPVTYRHAPVHWFSKYHYRVLPEATQAFAWLGLDVVSLANNHVDDEGKEGLLDTVRALDSAGIAHIGGGSSEAAARRPVIFRIGGIRVGFLAYLEGQLAFRWYLRTFAHGEKPGCALLDVDAVSRDIHSLRSQVDYLIVSVHWGENYAPITTEQERWGHALLDAGADVVAGHHPHCEQAVEHYGNKLILYSLGNYAWGAPGHDDLRVGLVARITLSDHAVPASLALMPLVTQNRIVHFQPRRLASSESPWLDSFLQESARRGALFDRLDDAEGVMLRAR